MAQTFGKYIFRNTIINRFHPALKFLMFIITMVIIFIPNGFAGYVILTVWIFLIYFLARIGWKTLFNIFKSIIFLFIVLFIINWLTMGGKENENLIIPSNFKSIAGTMHAYVNKHYISNSWFSLSDRAIYMSIYVSIKIFLMIIAATILTATTSSIELTTAIEDLLRPFKILHLPVNEVAMIISIALRFIPSLVDESQRILKAQASRGIDATNGRFFDKSKAIISLIVPLFSIAFQKADDLANAMESKLYNPRYLRTRYRSYKIRFIDFFVYFLLIVYLTFMICAVVWKFYFAPFGKPEAIILFFSK